MDFVVAEILLGALGVIAGEAYRIVATRREPASRRSQRRPGDTRLVRAGWNRCCQAIGLLLTTSGAFLLLVTLVATLLGVSDGVGWLIVGVLGIGGILFDAIGGWSAMNRYRVGGFDPVIRGYATAADAAGFAQEFDELFDDRSVPGTNPVPVAAPQDDPTSAPDPEPVAANPELAPADIQAGQPSQSSSSLTAEVSASAEAAEDQPIGASSPDTNQSTVADVPIATADRQDAVPPNLRPATRRCPVQAGRQAHRRMSGNPKRWRRPRNPNQQERQTGNHRGLRPTLPRRILNSPCSTSTRNCPRGTRRPNQPDRNLSPHRRLRQAKDREDSRRRCLPESTRQSRVRRHRVDSRRACSMN